MKSKMIFAGMVCALGLLVAQSPMVWAQEDSGGEAPKTVAEFHVSRTLGKDWAGKGIPLEKDIPRLHRRSLCDLEAIPASMSICTIELQI